MNFLDVYYRMSVLVGSLKIYHFKTEGILYKLDCTVQGCNEICYVGESMKRAEERFVGHLNTINLDCYENINLPVARHFRDMPGHSGQSDIKFTAFEKVKSKDPHVRKAREAEIINNYNLLTFGLNRYL